MPHYAISVYHYVYFCLYIETWFVVVEKMMCGINHKQMQDEVPALRGVWLIVPKQLGNSKSIRKL